MNASEFESRLKVGVGGQELWDLRRDTAVATAAGLCVVGKAMAGPKSVRGHDSEGIHAMGSLLQMSGELGLAAGRMLSAQEHYAGAALLRQVVEIEYLTWTFKEGHESVNAWLHTTYEQRMKVFSPGQLRRNAKGRFLSQDYQNHCEQGGHPVPRGISLLGGKEVGSAQLLLVDLITHSWRTWDQVRNWLMKFPDVAKRGIPKAGVEISLRLAEWGKRDPIYALSVELHPDTA